MDPGHAARIHGLCADGLDWSAAITTARRHGLTPLLHRHLATLCPGRVPPAALAQLGAEYEVNAVRNRLLAARLRAVLNVLAAAGIPAIAYKGPALAVAVYGDLALRRFADLDILVRREDVLQCKQRLVAHGYRPRWAFTPAQEVAYLASECEYILDGDRGRLAVEIHWDIAPRAFSFRLDHERLWKAARPMPFEGTTVLVPAPEDLLVMLSVHASKHLWERLGWICDIAECVRAHPALDWAAVLADARARGGERMVLLGLVLAADLLEVPVPAAALDRCRVDPIVATLARRLQSWIVADRIPPPRSMAAFRFTATMRERWRDRLRYVLRSTLTPTVADWAFVRLPARVFFLHYPLRLLRLAAVRGGGWLRLLSGR
jgi:hypothetical protein